MWATEYHSIVVVITMAQAKADLTVHSLLILDMAECIIVATKGKGKILDVVNLSV